MKNVFTLLILSLFFITNSLLADDHKTRMRPQDRLIFDIFLDVWQNTPEEIDLKFFNRGINLALYHDYPLGYSNFSIAPGISFTSHNLYSDHRYVYLNDIDGFGFDKIDDALSYSNNKISLNYIEVPFEFRFRTRPSTKTSQSFHVALGVKLGYLLQAHTKYAGEDIVNNSTRDVKIKEHKLNNIETWRYGVMLRFGYGYVCFSAYVPLTGIFEDNHYKDMVPFSIGLSFIIN